MTVDMIQMLDLKKIEIPQILNQETVEPIMERIFTSNPYHWNQRCNYMLIGGGRPLWFVEKWVEESFEIYEGVISLDFPEVSQSEYLSESEAKWQVAWDWSRARRELLPLIHWNADEWLQHRGFQLHKYNSTSTEMMVQKIKREMEPLTPVEFSSLLTYHSYRKQRVDESWEDLICVRCGEFRADQVYSRWGTDFLVFPFPTEDEISELSCYYIKFNEKAKRECIA